MPVSLYTLNADALPKSCKQFLDKFTPEKYQGKDPSEITIRSLIAEAITRLRDPQHIPIVRFTQSFGIDAITWSSIKNGSPRSKTVEKYLPCLRTAIDTLVGPKESEEKSLKALFTKALSIKTPHEIMLENMGLNTDEKIGQYLGISPKNKGGEEYYNARIDEFKRTCLDEAKIDPETSKVVKNHFGTSWRKALEELKSGEPKKGSGRGIGADTSEE